MEPIYSSHLIRKRFWDRGATGAVIIDIDLGEQQPVDTVFLGFTTADAQSTWSIATTTNMAGADEFTLQESSPFALSGSRARPHGLALVAEPATTRYLRIRFAASGSASLPQAGILMIGTRFEHPYELKSGRRPIDLSDRADLVGGGFGFGRGAIKSSYRFTFSGLDDTQLGALLDTVEAVGIQHPVLVVEGGDGPITQRQVHYGVFNAFEAYEREDPADTRWSLSITDWV